MSSELWPTFYRAPQNSSLDDSEDSIECWTTHRIYKKHVEDVSDLSWAADSSKIASCGIDHSVFIWDVEQPGKEPIARLDLHTHYIQGIAFDPFGQIVVSLSADRTMRVYQAMKKSKKSKTKEWRQKYKVHAIQPAGYERQVRLWWDDTLPGFVRRLNWSPEGSFLVAPAAELNPPPSKETPKDENMDQDVIKIDVKENQDPLATKVAKKECVAVFIRGTLQTPMALIPCSEPSVATRWCPKLFKLDPNKKNVSTLPYRMIFAVATSENGIGSVILYDTQEMRDVYHIEGMHYANMTDLAWCPMGKHLFISSRDGYVSRIDFDDDELGQPYEKSLSEVRSDVLKTLDDKEVIEPASEEVDSARLSPKLEKMILNSPKVKVDPIVAPKRPADSGEKSEPKKSKKKVAFTTISSN